MKYIEKIGVDEQICPLTVCMCSETAPFNVLSGIKSVNFEDSVSGNVYIM
jgi:hypothetical protein